MVTLRLLCRRGQDVATHRHYRSLGGYSEAAVVTRWSLTGNSVVTSFGPASVRVVRVLVVRVFVTVSRRTRTRTTRTRTTGTRPTGTGTRRTHDDEDADDEDAEEG